MCQSVWSLKTRGAPVAIFCPSADHNLKPDLPITILADTDFFVWNVTKYIKKGWAGNSTDMTWWAVCQSNLSDSRAIDISGWYLGK